MNRKTLFTVATAVIAVLGAAASAVADDAPNGRPTRAEIRAAATEASHNARLVNGEKAGESDTAFTSIATRSDVLMAAAAAARGTGRVANGEKTGDVEGPFVSALTRAQVAAETLEAIRIGAINFGGDYGPQIGPTEAQLEQIRMAGLKARSMTVASR